MSGVTGDKNMEKLWQFIKEFDKEISIVDFYLNNEFYYDLVKSKENVNYMLSLLSNCSKNVK